LYAPRLRQVTKHAKAKNIQGKFYRQ
jgi:hypothetical protein